MVEWSFTREPKYVEIYLEDGTTITVKVDNRTGELTITWSDNNAPHQ